MIVVDSGAWVAYFNGDASAHADRLERALAAEDDVAVLPIIVTEVLQGFRTEPGFRRARSLLTALPVLVPDIHTHVRAAMLFRALRSRGITARGAVDCVIAQTCIDVGAALLSPGRDFVRISQESKLRLVSA